jgi:hypothetical protein
VRRRIFHRRLSQRHLRGNKINTILIQGAHMKIKPTNSVGFNSIKTTKLNKNLYSTHPPYHILSKYPSGSENQALYKLEIAI